MRQVKDALAFDVHLPAEVHVGSHEPAGTTTSRLDTVTRRFARLRERLGSTAGCTTCATS